MSPKIEETGKQNLTGLNLTHSKQVIIARPEALIGILR
jgi:hypothetical protein